MSDKEAQLRSAGWGTAYCRPLSCNNIFMNYSNSLFEKYLRLLKVTKQKPSLNALAQIIKAHLITIPFENISKIYYRNRYNLSYVPDLELYLDGIMRYNFGGTCYSNNYYLNQLLKFLGYEVRLCGADMSNPDVHIVNIVSIENQDFLTDVGYAAPFYSPIPIKLNDNFEISFGSDKYIFTSDADLGHTKLTMYRNNQEKHGYIAKHEARDISEFEFVIKSSFRQSATFFNALLLIKFYSKSSLMIHNYSLVESNPAHSNYKKIQNVSELIDLIVRYFKIPNTIVTQSVNYISNFSDAWN